MEPRHHCHGDGHRRAPTANCTPCVSSSSSRKTLPPRLEGDFSPEFKEFVARCLQKDGGRRPRARDPPRRAVHRARGGDVAGADATRRRTNGRGGGRDDRDGLFDGGEADAAPTPEPPSWISATGPSREGSTDPPEAARKTRADEDDAFRTRRRRRRRRRRDRNRTGTRNRDRNLRRARVRYPSRRRLRWCSHPRQPPPGDRRPRRRMRRRE